MPNILSIGRPIASVDAHVGKYQPFIDGLRAIAVGAVILFHLFPTVLQGGFVGVDVFFVISGYLITGQIRQQVAAGTFSIGSFYARRIRRIAPALITMLVFSSVAAMLILKPEDMQSFAKSLLAQPLSMQNFVFLAEGEYFRGADTKPLLHTWSLAIEEQFYLFWPLLLLAVRRMRRASMLTLILALIAGSFVVNNQLIALSPKSSFFLLPTRAWELAMGGLVALLHENRHAAWLLPQPGAAAVSGVGVLLILCSILYIDPQMAFPGNVAMLPVLGTFLVLLYGGEGQATQWALTNRAMLAVGLLSYPLYLWHWPVLSFMHYLGLSTHAPVGVTLFIVLTFSLSVLCNRFIEVPIRRRRWLARTGTLCAGVAAAFAALTLLSIHLIQTQGALYRFDARARAFLATSFDAQGDRCGFFFRAMHPKAEVCELVAAGGADRRVMLWGNSHADMWSAALSEQARAHGTALFLNAKNCRGTADSAFCGQTVQNSILQDLAALRVTDVVLASTWHTSYGIADNVFEAALRAQVGRIAALGVRIWLVVDVPVAPQFDPVVAYGKNPNHPVVGVLPLTAYAPQRDRELQLFQRAQAAHPHLVRIVDVHDVFCNKAQCIAGRDGQVWYRDDGHLTNTGARAGMRAFDAIFAP